MKRVMQILGVLFFAAFPVYAADDVAARVNGTVITLRQLEQEVDALIPQATFHGNVTEDTRNNFREKALGGLIDRELKYQDAVIRGVKLDDKKVKAQMGLIRDRFKSKEAYRAALEKAGVTVDELRLQIEKSVLVLEVTERTVTDRAVWNDASLKEYYDKNSDKFRQPESVKLRLLSTRDEKKGKEALGKIRNNEDFGSIAAKMSEDNYRIKGGDIGYIHRGRILQALEDAAFKMQPGVVSDLIKADGTWYIIKVEEKKPEQQLTFEEAKDKLKKELEEKRSKELNDTWIADLRSKAKIELPLKTNDRGQTTDR